MRNVNVEMEEEQVKEQEGEIVGGKTKEVVALWKIQGSKRGHHSHSLHGNIQAHQKFYPSISCPL